MTYTPIKDADKQKWIDWLKTEANILDDKPEIKDNNYILESPEGDVGTVKDLVGNLLALLTNETVTIN